MKREYANDRFPCLRGSGPVLARIDLRLLRTAAIGGLLGGLVLFFLIADCNAGAGMRFLTILNVCFAAWVFRGTTMNAVMLAEHRMGMHRQTMGMHRKTMGMHHAMGTQHAMGMQHTMGAAMMNEPLSASHVLSGLTSEYQIAA